jgi:hypothetical protein
LRLRGAQAFVSWSRGKTLLDASLAATGARFALWTMHDIRRSVATGMAELGIIRISLRPC